MKVLVVDDEPLARQRLSRFLEGLDQIKLVGEAVNGVDALDKVQQLQPDILLLDIRMPGMTGLEVARHLTRLEKPPAIIFCTAYDDFALEAIRLQAVDYLLKPVRINDLEQALAKAGRVNRVQAMKLIGEEQNHSSRTHISIRSHRGIDLIPVESVRCFRAEQKYVVVCSDQGEQLLDESLKTLEQEFADRFIRIHRNSLVALPYIERLSRNEQGQSLVHLKGLEEPFPVSRRHLGSVKKRLQGR
jgi:two-component system response regulator AlgR